MGCERFVLLEGGGSKEMETPGAGPECQSSHPGSRTLPENELLQVLSRVPVKEDLPETQVMSSVPNS